LKHIEDIQILRALAALAIVVHHGMFDTIAFTAAAGAVFTPPRLLPWPAGVDLFFVISGFVMVYSSQRLFAKAGAPRLFLWRRLARIAPLYWATTALVLAVAHVAQGLVNSTTPSLALTLASFAFIPMMRPEGAIQPVYSLGWTLNYEMFFYAVFALFMPLSRPRAVTGIALTLAGVAVLGVLVRPENAALAFWSSPMILLFVAGMGIATLRLDGIGFALPLRLILIITAFALLALDPFGLMRDPLAIVQTLDFTRVIAWGVPAALLVAAAALRAHDSAREPKSGGFRNLLVALGEASYALYLIHPFVFRPVREVLVRLGLAQLISPWPYLALIVICASLAALAVHWLAERPVTAYLQAKFA
jgi:peptidoglycan/LPS O-acetylase OafA/YrhL